MEAMIFYDRVKELCKQNKVTIEEVVNKAGLSLASYNSYKRHENLPRANEAVIIAKALNTTVEYLVTGQGVVSPSRNQLETLEKALIAVQDVLKNK